MYLPSYTSSRPIASPQNDRLAAALRYAERRLPIYPVHWILPNGQCSCGDPRCNRRGKHPCIPHGIKAATTDPAQIETWWQDYPDANLGCAMGRESGYNGSVGLDMDPRNGGQDTLRNLEAEYGKLPDTPRVRTGSGGLHFFFEHTGGYIPTRAHGLGDGVDVIADGGNGCLILPPSIHASGRRYEWEVCHELWDIPCAPLPAWVRDKLEDSLSLSRGNEPKHQGKEIASKGNTTGALPLLAITPDAFPLRPGAPLSKEGIQELLANPAVIDRVLMLPEFTGARRGKTFSCLLHPPDEHPSAAIAPPTKARPYYAYNCFHDPSARSLWPLVSVFKARKTNTLPELLPKPTLLAWTLRMLNEAGVLSPAPVPKPPKLLDDAPDYARIVYAGVQDLLAAKWHVDKAPTPLVHKFMEAWCGVSEHYCREGIRWLMDRGFLIKAGMYNKMMLFRIGVKDTIKYVARKAKAALTPREERRTQTQISVDIDEAEAARLAEAAKLEAEIASHDCKKDGYRPKGNGCVFCIDTVPRIKREHERKRATSPP